MFRANGGTRRRTAEMEKNWGDHGQPGRFARQTIRDHPGL
jgi:hypothetical protein